MKWSIRLFFYACYGLFPTQFILNLRKKDHHLINKEFIRSTAFYLRLHPSLLREKGDSTVEKQLKQTAPNCDDYSLEWRQYCLDPMCTNFNQVINELGRSHTAASLLYGLANPALAASSRVASRVANVNSSASLSPFLLGSQSLLASEPSGYVSFPPPLSPSGLFSSSNNRISGNNCFFSASSDLGCRYF